MNESVLIVEDDTMQQQMLGTLLRRKLGFESCFAGNGREALDILAGEGGQAVKLVILDISMPVMGGMEALEIIHQRYPALPVIMLTGNRDIEEAVRAMKLGAVDFVVKPYEGERMAITVKNALKLSLLSREVARLKQEREGRFVFENLIGHDGGLMPVVAVGRKAAGSDIPVLITGETGVGKEAFAMAVHGESARAGRPFIAVNCGAIPAQLVESTLFGHEKGAFTGATEKTAGKFREAEGGTIFLDEVGELPLDAQVKLLRVLQQKEVEPVGAGKPVAVNVRIISATNRDLEADVKAGRFREDLYFRLNVLQIEIPPLRARRDDILVLARHFIDRMCAQESLPPRELSAAAQQNLMRRDWPGNVRELENAIKRAVVLNEGGVLDVDDFTAAQEKGGAVSAPVSRAAFSIFNEDGSFKTVAAIEEEAMALALARFGGNITRAAEALGMAKSTFYRKSQKS